MNSIRGGPGDDFGYLPCSQPVGEDHLVRSCAQELFGGGVLGAAGQDKDLRIQLAGGQGDVEVLGVGLHHADDGAGPLDAGLAQHLVRSGVPLDDQSAQFKNLLGFVGLLPDHDQGKPPLVQLLGDDFSHPAVAADDHVPGKAGRLAFHAIPPEEVSNLAFHDELGDHGEDVQGCADAEQDQHDGEGPPGGIQRSYLAVADGGDGGEGHEKGVGEAPPQDQPIAEGPEGDDERRHQECRSEPLLELQFHWDIFSCPGNRWLV